MRRALVLLVLLGGCSSGPPPAPRSPEEEACARQANEDPVVRDMQAKAAGNLDWQWQNGNRIRMARQDATTRCLRARGLAPMGGVERPRQP